MRGQRTLFDLTQDGLVIGKKIQCIYPEFNVSGFVLDVRTEMVGQTLYNVGKGVSRVAPFRVGGEWGRAWGFRF